MLNEAALTTDDHLQTARSFLRAIMMSASAIVTDQRDSMMLHELVYGVEGQLDAIEKAVRVAA